MKMKNYKFLLILFTIMFNDFSFAQPANDNCSGAINLGTLPIPGTCNTGLQDGAPTTIMGSTFGSSADNPFIYQTNCQGSSNSMNAPNLDVWYKFTATGTILNINLTGFPNANIALWSGNGCGNLAGLGCSIGNAAGITSLVATQANIDSTYYLSIGGNTNTQTSNFNLSIDNDIDCNNCLRQSTLTANPVSINGAYQPGQVVQFCFKVTEWQIQNHNWFHGVQISMGDGWTGTISNISSANSCDTEGEWIFTPNGIGIVNGVNWNPGYYYQRTAADNDPTKKYGDDCFGTDLDWTFCFALTVKPDCFPGSNLSVTINTSSDGESGSWNSTGCAGDNPTTLNAIGACCAPNMASTPTCFMNAIGTATATPIGTAGPYNYSWSPSGQTTQTANNLISGTYTVTITDANLCVISNSITVDSNPIPTVTVNNLTICPTASGLIVATPDIPGTYTYTWTVPVGFLNPGNVSSFSTSIAGVYSVIITNTSTGCISESASGIVSILPLSATINNPSICAGNPATVFATSNSSGSFNYSWSVPAGANPPGNVASFTTLTPGIYSVVITNTITGCSSPSASGNVVQNQLPTVNVNSPLICSGQSTTVTAIPNTIATYNYSWTIPPGAVSPGNVATFSTSTPGTYSVIITNTITGCMSTIASGIAIANPIPTVTVNSSTICEGTTTTVTAIPSGSGTYSYTWTVPVGANLPGDIASFTTTTNGIYSVIVTDLATLCSSVSSSGNVTVITSPIATISGTTTICSGKSSLVTFNGTPNATVNYSINAGSTLSLSLNAQGTAVVSTGVLSSTTTYILTGINSTTAPFCAKSLNSSAIITIENPPTISFNSNITSGCAPLTVNFTNTTINSFNCTWNFGDGTVTNGCGTVSHKFSTAGCYDISLSASSPNACFASENTASMICVKAKPIAAFNPTPSIITSLNTSSTMVNSSTGATNYEWHFGDETTSTDTSPIHIYNLQEDIDNYTIKLIAFSQQGCSDTAYAKISLFEDLIYYIPNTFTPDGDKFNQTFQPVFTKGIDPYSFNMIVLNRWGEVLFESNNAKIGWDGSYGGEIVQDGVYTWKLTFKLKFNDVWKMENGHVVILR
jgi:gliding motility-associated-like protein